ncbi:MAG: hypothetical protein OEZ55_05960 [Nitrospinota bacterium]|nr:hypothetical protein [Nitrospinota bacterium]
MVLEFLERFEKVDKLIQERTSTHILLVAGASTLAYTFANRLVSESIFKSLSPGEFICLSVVSATLMITAAVLRMINQKQMMELEIAKINLIYSPTSTPNNPKPIIGTGP